MKTCILMILLIAFQYVSTNTSHSQISNNVTIEYCTGTWASQDPCAHAIIDQILHNFPNTVALAYHGAASDPWQSYSSGIRSLLGLNAYPTGVVGRITGIVNITYWMDQVSYQSQTIQPGVSINLSNKNYKDSTRTLTSDITITSLSNLTGDFYVNYILTENNLVYSQAGTSTCIGGSYYIHNHVVKSMLNGNQGELIHSGNWTSGIQVLRNINFIIPNAPQVSNVSNCELNIFVYKRGISYSQNSNIQQSFKTSITGQESIRLNLKLLLEGLYSSNNNTMSRKDSVIVYLCSSISPFNKLDSAKSVIDSLSFLGSFQFYNAPAGTYYIVVKNFNSIETWSKAGGEHLIYSASYYNYDFTSSGSQAYGNNLKLNGSKYCIYSGDVNQDGYITLVDVIQVYNDASNFLSGRFLATDLTGDNFVDLTDVTLGYNNSASFVSKITP